MDVLEQCTAVVVSAVSQSVGLGVQCFNFLNMGSFILGLVCSFLAFRYLLSPFIGWANSSLDSKESKGSSKTSSNNKKSGGK